MHQSVRWAFISALVLAFTSLDAMAGLTADVHRLLIAERYDQADTRAQAALAAATGTDKAAQTRRSEALNLLIDSAIVQHRLTNDSSGAWIEEVLILDRAVYGDKARQLARPLAAKAARERLLGSEQHTGPSANELIQQSVELVEHGDGNLEPCYQAYVFEILAAMAVENGRFDQAVTAIQRAETVLQDVHTDDARSLHALQLAELGLYQQQLGNASAALLSAQAGLELASRLSGRKSRLYAGNLTELGKIQFFSADYLGARATLQSAIDILRTHPSEHFVIGSALSFLANATQQIGDYDAARPLYEESIADTEGDAKPFLAGRLLGLAILEKRVGHADIARTTYARVLSLYEQQHGTTYYGLVPVLNNLGGLALKQNDIAAARDFYQRAQDISSTHGTAAVYNIVMARDGLASVALALGNPQEADTLLTKSISELTSGYGNQHPDLVFMRCEQALAKARLGQYAEAFDLVESGEQFRVDMMRRIAPALSEGQVLNLKRRLNNCSGLMLALAQATHDDHRTQSAWRLVASSRGLATRLVSTRLAAARNAADAAGKERWSQWEHAARDYADLLLRTNVATDALNAARSALDKAEAGLGAPVLSAVGFDPGISPMNSLHDQPSDGTLVAYVQADNFELDPQARSDPQVRDLETARHIIYALVREGNETRMLTLGDSARIDTKIEYWNKLLQNPASDVVQLAAAGRAVREAIWDPLAITDVAKHVFVVPDGALFRVNFAALPDGDGYLVERGWRVHLLDAERDLDMRSDAGKPSSLLLVGSPDFGQLGVTATDGRRDLCATGFNPLPGTKVEMQRVAVLWHDATGESATVLSGRAANKGALRAAAAKSSVIHIATHAVEFDKACTESLAVRGMSLSFAPAAAHAVAPSAALALAGANDYLAHQNVAGILTSDEVVTMPLDQTQWVVLAACDTGLGEVIDGEGVFGLRRAFRLAGARTVIMSLWKVDDDATADWMEALYRARLQQHNDTPEAIAQAELSVLSARRVRSESTHPFYWAAFVASGDWR